MCKQFELRCETPRLLCVWSSLARARTANVNDGDGGVDAMDARRAIGTRREDPTDGLGDDGARRR